MPDEPTSTVLTQSPNGRGPSQDDDVDFVLEHLDEYEKEPKLKRARRVVTPLTWILASLILAAGMFALGAKMGNDHGTSSSSSSAIPSNLASLFRNRTGAAGGTGATSATGTGAGGARGGAGGTGAAGAGGGGATIGTVKLVDGTNVYVSTTSGSVVKVTTTPSVTVNVTAPGSLADLKPGETVTVQGTASADGTTMAGTSISQVSAGGFGGGGFGARAAGGGAGTGTGAGG